MVSLWTGRQAPDCEKATVVPGVVEEERQLAVRLAAAAAATITFCSSAINSPSSVVRIFRTKPSTTPWAACAERPLAGSRLSLLQEDETAKTI